MAANWALMGTNGLRLRTITGDTFSRAVEAEVKAGRSLAGADLTQLGRYGDPTDLNLAGGTFTGADFSGSVLVGADLTGADCTNATIRNVNWQKTKQTRLTLTNATQVNVDAKEAKDQQTK